MAGVGMSGMMGGAGRDMEGRKDPEREVGTQRHEGTERRARETAQTCQNRERHGETERHLETAVEWMPSTVSEQQGVTGMACLPTALSSTGPHTNRRALAEPWPPTAMLLLGQGLGTGPWGTFRPHLAPLPQ